MKNYKMKIKNFSIILIILFAVLMVYAIMLCGSLGWGIMTSFKNKSDYFLNRLGFPDVWTIENYSTALKYLFVEIEVSTGFKPIYIETMYLYSILYAAGGAFVQTAVTCLVAWTTSKFDCKFSRILYAFVLFTMSLTIVGSLPSELQVAHDLGLYDSMLGMYFMKAHFLSVYFLVFYAAFKGLPSSYFEAAELDGAGQFCLLFRIAVPLIKNIFITVFLLFLIQYWNDYQTPMLFLPSYPTVAYGIYKFSQKSQGPLSSVPAKLAGCMFLLLPMLAVFVAFNKTLLAGVSMGGIKE